jgi:hypothetical protein
MTPLAISPASNNAAAIFFMYFPFRFMEENPLEIPRLRKQRGGERRLPPRVVEPDSKAPRSIGAITRQKRKYLICRGAIAITLFYPS